MTRLHRDYETRSEEDITTAGSYRYARHPSTEALMLGWALEDDAVDLWDIHGGQPMPADLKDAYRDPSVELWAFNAEFERGIDRHVMNLDIPLSRYRCTMTLGYAMSLGGMVNIPGSKNIAQGLAAHLLECGAPEQYWKDSAGKGLINLFCKPKSKKGGFIDPFTHLNQWELFKGYCRQDVEAERWLTKYLLRYAPMSDIDWAYYADHVKINEAGLPIDLHLVAEANRAVATEKARLKRSLADQTGLSNPNSRDQMLGWLRLFGADIEDLTKETVNSYRKGDVHPAIDRALDEYQQLNRSSTAKWAALPRCVGDGGRLRGAHVFKGASRTGRDAHRLFAPGNLPRGTLKDPVGFSDMLLVLGHYGATQYSPKNVMESLSSNIRTAITAPPGHTLVISDLASIESRMVGWLSSCTKMHEIFSSGRDTYKEFASWYYGVPYTEVTSAMRKFCKPPVLGCAYMLAGKGLVAYAEGMGVAMEEDEAQRLVSLFRSRFHEIVEMWTWLDQAARYCILRGQGASVSGYRVTLERDGDFLFIRLPSGRRLAYMHPRIDLVSAPWDKTQKIENVTYMGHNIYTKGKWVRISTHPGKWVEQITQAASADLFWHGIHSYGGEIILRVHDEIVAVVPEDQAETELKRLEHCMAARPPWGDTNLLLGAEGYISKRYRKE